MNIHPISLSFKEEYEKSFRAGYFEQSLPVTRVALMLTGVLYGSFAYLDFQIVDEVTYTFLFIRFLVVIPLISATLLLSFTPVFRKIWQELVLVCLIVGGAGINIMIYFAPHAGSYYGGLLLVLFAGYFFVRLRFLYASLGGWVILIMFNVLIITSHSYDLELLISYNFFYIAANLIGMFGLYYIELSIRKNYLLNLELNKSKEELEHINHNLEQKVEDRNKDLSESEERFRNLSELLPLMVYEIDTQGKITYTNLEAMRQLGITKQEAYSGMNVLEFVAPVSKQKAIEGMTESLESPGIKKGEYLALRKDGTTFPVMDYSSPIIKENRVVGLRSVVVDLSEQKINEKLRMEVDVARESSEFKQNFLANMSHEIRTPLTGIIGIVEILLQTPLNSEQQEHLGTLKQSTENLREIINQILDYSKIEAGKVFLRPVVFPTLDIFENARKLFESVIQKPVELVINVDDNVPPYLEADVMRIQQIVSNLLSNAIKFTNKGVITLKASALKWINDQNVLVKISVNDTGIGIVEEKQKMLFQPFSQVEHNDTRNFEGTGLGLTISKELTQLLKGDIGLKSKSGKGSEFWFTFQARVAARTELSETAVKKEREDPLLSLRILVVEDKVINQKVIGLMLSSQGHIVANASNGQQAVELYDPTLFDLILMDIQMPVMDGITATREIRKKYGEKPLIVGLSANAFEGDREKYMARGMDDYITKPVKSDDFKHLIDRWFLTPNK